MYFCILIKKKDYTNRFDGFSCFILILQTLVNANFHFSVLNNSDVNRI